MSSTYNIVLIKLSLASESQVLMDCYQENLFGSLVEQLNTSLVMVGKLSSCSTDVSRKSNAQIRLSQPISHAIFVMTVTNEYYRLMVRDLIYSDQHVWNEALIIYDQAQGK